MACAVPRKAAFTLIELLISLSILALASLVAFLAFTTISKAWQRGLALAEDLNHGDLIMEQLVVGLRSAYFPDVTGGSPTYGFWLEDKGTGRDSHDTISWVKLGTALAGDEARMASAPHRVMFSVENNGEHDSGAAVRLWRPYGQEDDFDPMKLNPVLLSTKVVGFDCKVATNLFDEALEWEDEWDDTNRLPQAIQLTLYLQPLGKGEEPVEIKRIVGLPVAPISWR